MLGAMVGPKREIDRAIQRAYLRVWLTTSAVFIVVIASTTFFGWWVLARSRINPYFLDKLSLILRANAVLLVLVTLFMGLYSVTIGHRITGPSWRIQSALRRAADARRYDEPVEVHDHDYLQSIAGDTNHLLQRLRGDQQRVLAALTRIERARDALDRAAAGEPAAMDGEALQALREELDEACRALRPLSEPEALAQDPPAQATQEAPGATPEETA